MANRASIFGRVAAASSLALLLSAPVYAVDQYGNNNTYRVAQNHRISVEGRITNITREGSGGKYDVTLDNGGTYRLSRATMRDNNLAVGQFVHFDGYMRGRNAFVENVMLSNDPNWNYSRSNPTNSYGYGTTNANYMTGIVESTNRHLNYFTVRDTNGRLMKVDVRNMDTRRSVNVWNLRPGDRISVNGGWENSDTFRADTVNF